MLGWPCRTSRPTWMKPTKAERCHAPWGFTSLRGSSWGSEDEVVAVFLANPFRMLRKPRNVVGYRPGAVYA